MFQLDGGGVVHFSKRHSGILRRVPFHVPQCFGLKFFRALDRKEVKKIIVSVKGGGIKPDDVRALNSVRDREKADIALFISLEHPTQSMISDAAAAGIYTALTGKKYKRIALLTIHCNSRLAKGLMMRPD